MKVLPAVSPTIVSPSQPLRELTADSASPTDQLSVTFDVSQPLLPSVPLTCGVITGGVVSVGLAAGVSRRTAAGYG